MSAMSARWPRPIFYLVLFFALAADHITKYLTVAHFKYPGDTLPIIPGFFSLTYVQNTGIAFGMFRGQTAAIVIIIVAVTLLALYYASNVNWAKLEPNILGGCLVAGAVGNVIDRARLGYVVDFFDVHAGKYGWPVFNVADSLICVSVGWILIRQLTSDKKLPGWG